MYFAPGAMHSPHHVPKEWADKYKGKFDKGWDVYRKEVFARQKKLGVIPKNAKLSRHDPDIQNWEKLSKDEKKVYTRMMEVFAGFLEHADHYIGELINFLKEIAQFDNTLVMLISDNGSSAEGGPTGSVNECRFFNNLPDKIDELVEKLDEIGGPTTFNHFPYGWTFAGNTPFRRWKRETYRGGISDPFIIHWPKGIKSKGQIRNQYTHVIDMVPTVLDALGIEPPQLIKGISQSPIEGVSLVSTFDNQKDPGKHITQYFEMLGHRSIYHDGWRAVCPWPGTSFIESGRKFGTPIDSETLTKLDANGWELYNLKEDFAETNNLASKEKARLIEMIGMWYNEAGKYNVLPVDGRGTQRIAEQRPLISLPRGRYVLYNDTQAIPANAAPKILNKHYSITADVVIPKGGAEGVLLSMGGNDGGITFYIQNKKLCFAHNYVTINYFYVKSDKDIPEGKHFFSVEFTPTGKAEPLKGKGTPGKVELFIDGKSAGKTNWPVTTPIRLGQGAQMQVGTDGGSSVIPDYKPPFKFTGELKKVIVDVSGETVSDYESEMAVALRKQ
jgi:arylsulfatase